MLDACLRVMTGHRGNLVLELVNTGESARLVSRHNRLMLREGDEETMSTTSHLDYSIYEPLSFSGRRFGYFKKKKLVNWDLSVSRSMNS